MTTIVDKYGLSAATIKAVQACFGAEANIETAILYGSRAKGNYRPGSDVDLCLIGSELSTKMLFALRRSLDELNTPYKFDLSIHHQIEHKDLLEHIARVGIPFYKKSE